MASQRTWRQVLEMLIGVGDGLATAHEAGILHRDIKPENNLLTRSGYAKLADFGLARLDDRSSPAAATRTLDGPSRVGVIVGTFAYMSPEQAAGRRVDARSDVFSFGVVLYEVLTGRRPSRGESELEALQALIHGSAEPLGAGVPAALSVAVERALEKNPDDRYLSMREMVVDLRRIARRSEESPAPAGPVASAGRWRAGIALGVASIAGATWLMYARMHPPAPAARLEYTPLTAFTDSVTSPALSPDGRMLAFIRGPSTFIGRGEVYVKLVAG